MSMTFLLAAAFTGKGVPRSRRAVGLVFGGLFSSDMRGKNYLFSLGESCFFQEDVREFAVSP